MKVIKVNTEDLEKAKEVLESNGISVEVTEDYYLTIEDNVVDIIQCMDVPNLSDSEYDEVIGKITNAIYSSEYSVLDMDYILDVINETIENL